MASHPVFEEGVESQGGALVEGFASQPPGPPVPETAVEVGRPGRRFCIYPARAGYELQEELDFLANRMMEPNVFFTGRFLAPAMPRLEDRQVRLVLVRDENERRSRLRMLMPFSVERPGIAIGPSILRVWSHPFGPLGTPLVDAEGAAETIDNCLEAMARPESHLPPVMVLPDVRLGGRFSELLRAVALGRGLTVDISDRSERPVLNSRLEGEAYIRQAVSRTHRKDMDRQWRALGREGALNYKVARHPDEVRFAVETFLALEASGWKGRRKSAMIADRYRAAFAREAVSNLAETDNVRIHTLELDGRAIATMIVFVISGQAYTWKTAYDEDHARFSPGKLLFLRMTEQHLEDPNIVFTDSCAVPDHPVASRLWSEREEMGTMVVGLKPGNDRDVRQVARQLHLYRNTRNLARIVRNRMRAIARRRVAGFK